MTNYTSPPVFCELCLQQKHKIINHVSVMICCLWPDSHISSSLDLAYSGWNVLILSPSTMFSRSQCKSLVCPYHAEHLWHTRAFNSPVQLVTGRYTGVSFDVAVGQALYSAKDLGSLFVCGPLTLKVSDNGNNLKLSVWHLPEVNVNLHTCFSLLIRRIVRVA